MHTGPITAQGQFYLQAAPIETRSADGVWHYTWRAVERYKHGDVWCSQPWALHWRGDAARDFHRAHQQALRAGCAVNTLIDRIRPHTDAAGTTQTARITGASIAPARWPDHTPSTHGQHGHQPETTA